MSNQNNENEQWKLLVILLKEIAEEKKISQLQIAESSNLLESNISRFFSLKYKPNLDNFLQVAKAIGVNFFFEDKDSTTDLNKCFERAMEKIGRRPDNLPQN